MPSSPSRMISLFVGNISRYVNYRELEKAFLNYGECKVKLHGKYGFVDFDHEKDAEDAKEKLQGKSFGGAKIYLEWSKRSGKFESKGRARKDSSHHGRSRSRSYSRSRSRKHRDNRSHSRSRNRKRASSKSYSSHRHSSKKRARSSRRREKHRGRSSRRHDSKYHFKPPLYNDLIWTQKI
jgi:RNA recognition motif-containing protein